MASREAMRVGELSTDAQVEVMVENVKAKLVSMTRDMSVIAGIACKCVDKHAWEAYAEIAREMAAALAAMEASESTVRKVGANEERRVQAVNDAMRSVVDFQAGN